MTELERLNARIEGLEIHAAHQTQIIDDLNAAIASQWQALDGLRRHLSQMAERMDEAETRAGPTPVQRPPHY